MKEVENIKIDEPSVAVIIVNWNSYIHTSGCLTSLRKVYYQNYKVVVVDNGSQDGSDKLLEKQFPEIILLRNETNIGFTGGNNRGIDYALANHFKYLMLLNNDTEVEPDFLNKLINVIQTDSRIGAVQPKFFFLHNKDRVWNAGGKIIRSIGWVRTIGENKFSHKKYDKPHETEWITGCCFLVRTSIVKKIGGLNDRFFIYFEDVEWSLRIKAAGYSLAYCPQAIVYHEAGMANKNKVKGKEGFLNPIVHYLVARNNVLLLRKYTPWYYTIPVIGFQFSKYAAIFGYFLIRRRFGKMKCFYKGLKEGLFGQGI